MQNRTSTSIPIELQVAAFTALREEISRRSNAQLQLMTISLLSFSTLAGLILSSEQKHPYELLLLVPLISSATGLLWLDHDRRIREIGDYIYDKIFKKEEGTFEERADELENKWLTRSLGFLAPTMLLFDGPTIAALSWAHKEGLHTALPVFWWIGLILGIFYTLGLGVVLWLNARARAHSLKETALN
ncbi:hypothetical protein SAMN05421823_104513 [Catalinimonas alkaloidigena]|uniref:Uncharacterized protein n=1 Tax=Catalinimonas alkaloidigena TaxID=1075417 RepID=A0A1G9HR92_9BACT|nr:hypothetical protein [Catalinimonas alkaloidigena]SDL15449.1 hypothetical protein SAMN05421823_104513 [Catalinimonas alkaloidigena]